MQIVFKVAHIALSLENLRVKIKLQVKRIEFEVSIVGSSVLHLYSEHPFLLVYNLVKLLVYILASGIGISFLIAPNVIMVLVTGIMEIFFIHIG